MKHEVGDGHPDFAHSPFRALAFSSAGLRIARQQRPAGFVRGCPESVGDMKHLIIGTAGHVDHGKTALIRALTGTETDRLKEEQERGMSIDLGFASFRLPSGRLAGVIDVPGHERFLKNMLAGAGGIDLVILVIAADEGVMPQTREHLEILQILQTRKGVVALTKADIVEEEWLELVQDEVREKLRGTFLEGAPILPVSSITGQGLPELTAILDRLSGEVETRPVVGPWRLPVDRAFTVGGFGTVVTGTLMSGTVRVGDRAEILPDRLETRVRGVQTHGQSAPEAEAGTRVALNLAGVGLEGVERGDVCCAPGALQPTLSIDARLDVLGSCPREVKNRTRVRLHLGSAELLARLTLLDAESLLPGGSGLIQLRLEQPTACAKGDRYVLRFYSPMHTIGGGAVLEPHAAKHRRFESATLENLTVKEQGTPEELLEEAVQRGGLAPTTPVKVAAQLGMPPEEARALIERLKESGRLLAVDGEAVLHAHPVEAAENQLLSALREFHTAQPLRVGMSREELRSRLSRAMDAKGFALILSRLERAGRVQPLDGRVRVAGYEPQYTPQQARVAQAIEASLQENPTAPPGFEEIVQGQRLPPAVAREVWEALIDAGTVVRVAEGVFFHRRALDQITQRVRAHLAEKQKMTASEFRDLIGSTRKYAVPLLEWLDQARVTRRVGDERILF
jgi:selenocysteine-specific elongation factor